MLLPLIIPTGAPSSFTDNTPTTQMEPLNFKQIIFTMTSVSSQSSVRYHIEDEDNAVHVFLNCPLSRLDLGTLTEILQHAEKPCHATKMPVSAPPSPNTVNNPSSTFSGSSTYMKFPKSLFVSVFGEGQTQGSSSSSDLADPQQSRKGGKVHQIHFYDRNKPHYGFTNFSEHAIRYKGQVYPTSEHLFQSLKFLDRQPYIAELIRLAGRPRDAFDLARQNRKSVRDDWFQVNTKMMDDVLWHKFTQHEDLKRELLATGDAELVEASDLDPFWGWGADHKGRNELGKALMRLRVKLRHNPFSL